MLQNAQFLKNATIFFIRIDSFHSVHKSIEIQFPKNLLIQ